MSRVKYIQDGYERFSGWLHLRGIP